MVNSVSLGALFGVTSANTNTVHLVCTAAEVAVDHTANTSTVQVTLTVVKSGPNNTQRTYTKNDAKVSVTVGGSTQAISGKACHINLSTAGQVGWGGPIHTMTWTGVDNSSGSVGISFTGSFPTAGANGSPSASGTLTLSPPVMAPPAAPTGLSASTVDASHATVSWSDNASSSNPLAPYAQLFVLSQHSPTGAEGTWVSDPSLSVSPTATSATVAVVAGLEYQFSVQAVNAAGAGTSDPVTFSAPGPIPPGGSPTTPGSTEPSVPLYPMGPTSSTVYAAAVSTHNASCSVVPVTTTQGIFADPTTIPLRQVRYEVPATIMRNGWPTAPPTFAISGTGNVNAHVNPAAVAARPVATAITTGADIRWLASGYNPASSGDWTPYAHGSSFGGIAWHTPSGRPRPRKRTGSNAFTYTLDNADRSLDCVEFSTAAGAFFATADIQSVVGSLNDLSFVAVLSPTTAFTPEGGLWSNAADAGSGVPNTTTDWTTFNYRELRSATVGLTIQALGMPGSITVPDDGALVHRPTYLGVTFSKRMARFVLAQDPSQPRVVSVDLGDAADAAISAVQVLGADARQGLNAGSFDLFELNYYLRAMTVDQMVREISLLGAVYG